LDQAARLGAWEILKDTTPFVLSDLFNAVDATPAEVNQVEEALDCLMDADKRW
jgi:hypothetical protein